ncbi:MAG: zinc ribbon domain-containing protein [Acidobacteria bacterium]|jgi:putative FmdB family regulatory protein|nr:zinc ribbon domain-containing protein [Acidobacteriota bacterium]
MPIYEYRCQACGDEFEVIQKLSEGPLKRCSKCGGRLEKLLSRTAFLLKGGGWYADGYGGSGPRKSEDSGGTPSKDAPTKDAPPRKSGSGASEGGGGSKSEAASPKPGGKPSSSD